MYALVYAAKGPFVLYKIYNISFEHGNDPPPVWKLLKKKLHFSYMEASFIVIIIYDHFYRLPNLATLDMSRNKIVEIEQGAFEGAYSIDEMWVFVFVFVLGFEGTHSIDEMWVTDDMMVFVMMMMLMVRKVSKKQFKSHG